MKRPSIALVLGLALVGVLMEPGCATVINRSTQKIPVTSDPIGAKVLVNGELKGVTPVDILLPRKLKGQVIRIEAPGYASVEIRPRRKSEGGAVAANFLAGIGLGFMPAAAWSLGHDEAENRGSTTVLIWSLSAVAIGSLFTLFDSAGPGYALEPRSLTVTLAKTRGSPEVETMFVDEKDLRSLTWIRVRAK